MIAEIIAAGSEMLTPYRQDTNSLFLTEALNTLGVQVAFKTIVGDNLAHLTSAARIAISRADIVIFSGGLGPTEDDLTREAAAAALNLTLHPDPAIIETLKKRFAARNLVMPSNNAKQADVLTGATILDNKNGSAPGQYLDTTIFHSDRQAPAKSSSSSPAHPTSSSLSSPNRSSRSCAPRSRRCISSAASLRMALIPESQVDARTAPIYQQYPDIETTILAGSGEIQLHFLCRPNPPSPKPQARVDELAEKSKPRWTTPSSPPTASASKRSSSSTSASATSPSAPPSPAPAACSPSASPPSPTAPAPSSAEPSSTPPN